MNDLRKLLRQGYVVEHMDGELSRVEMNAEEELVISGEYRWFPVENLTEQLEYICYFTNDKDYAPKVKIKAIYGLAEVNYRAYKASKDDRKIIWERGKESMNLELTNLTDEQKQQIIELAKKFERENALDKLDRRKDYGVLLECGRTEHTQTEDMQEYFKEECFRLGLTAHTKEEAEKIRRRLLVEKELRDWAKKCKEAVDWELEKKQDKYCIVYSNNAKKIILDNFRNYSIGNIIFTDSKTGEKAIESIGQERLIRDYFGIDN